MNEELNLEKKEQDIVAALMEAAALRPDGDENYPEVRVKRGEKNLFTFRIHGLTEDDFAKCRRQNLKNRGKRTEELDNARFTAQVVYEATVDDDKERIWKNKEAWKKFNVLCGTDLVKAVLTAGERNKIAEAVIDLSGFDDSSLDDLIKN